MRDTVTPKGIGQMLVTIGIAVASAAGVFMSQFGAMDARLQEVERHLSQSHPGQDYRDLIKGQIDQNHERIKQHEHIFHKRGD